MALIKCPSCNAGVSDEAEACLKCGQPIKPKKNPQTVFGILAAVVLGLLLFSLIYFLGIFHWFALLLSR
jgi:hypothetical protein